MERAIILTVLLTLAGCSQPTATPNSFSSSHRADAASYLTAPESSQEGELKSASTATVFSKCDLNEDFAPVQKPYSGDLDLRHLETDSKKN